MVIIKVWIVIVCQFWICRNIILVNAQYIQEGPSDVAIRIDEDVIMTCVVKDDYTGGVVWTEYITNTGTGREVLNTASNYTVDDQKYFVHGKNNLLIKNVTLLDGGTYSCESLWNTDEIYYAHLTVYEMLTFDPNIDDLYENDTQTVTCNTSLGVSNDMTDPVMAIKIKGNNPKDLSLNVTRTLINDTLPGSGSQILLGSAIYFATRDDRGIKCVVNVVKPKDLSITKEKGINVKYFLDYVTISPVQSKYEVGAKIECIPNGNPPSDCTWQSVTSPIGDGVHVNKATLTITENMTNASGSVNEWRYMAVQMNVGRPKKTLNGTIVFTVKEPKEEPKEEPKGSSPLLPAVIVLGILFTISTTLLIALFIKYKSKFGSRLQTSEQYMTPPGVQSGNNAGYENAATLQLDVRSDAQTYEQMNTNDVRPIGEDP